MDKKEKNKGDDTGFFDEDEVLSEEEEEKLKERLKYYGYI